MTETLDSEQIRLIRNKFESGDLSAFTDFAEAAADTNATFPAAGMYYAFQEAIRRGEMNKYKGLEKVGTVSLSGYEIEISDELDVIGYKKFRVVRKVEEVGNT